MDKQTNERRFPDAFFIGFLNLVQSGTFEYKMIHIDDRVVNFSGEDELLHFEIVIKRKTIDQENKISTNGK